VLYDSKVGKKQKKNFWHTGRDHGFSSHSLYTVCRGQHIFSSQYAGIRDSKDAEYYAYSKNINLPLCQNAPPKVIPDKDFGYAFW
jgi:hypothetical protein